MNGELERSSSLLRGTLEATADGILVVDADGRIVLYNRRFRELWRIPEQVLEERDDAAAIAWVLEQLRDPDAFVAKVRELYSDPQASSYDILYFKDGRVFERYSQPQVTTEGGRAGRVWSFRDVTEHRLAEAALRESERRSRALIENSSEGIVTFSADGSILWANPSAGAILGMHLSEARGRSLLSFIHDDDRPQVTRALDDVLTEPGRRVAQRCRVRRGDGRYVVLDGTFTNLLNEPGLHALAVHFRDVTESLALQDQLVQSQKMEAIGRLAGGVAHDFNNLLTAIVGHAELLKDQVEGPQAVEDIGEIEKAAERATSLTQQLLAFSRRQVLQPVVLDPNAAVEGMRRMLERIIGEHIKLVFRVSARGRVKADPTQLDQVILNLALNARDAMPKGGTLSIETSDSEIDEWFVRRHPGTRTGPHVCLTVTDTGVGMDDATRDRVFEPFFTTRPGGTGLGLSTVYGIVKQSGGHVMVESKPAAGAKFTIMLPRVDEPAAVRRPASDGTAVPDGTETILLVEDEAIVRELAAKVLRQRGYTVLVADGGPAAFAAASAHQGPIHLLLADVVMPDMSGPAVAERLRAERPDARVLYMSGYADESMVDEGMLSKGAPFLPKPFAPADLAAKVREVLDDKSDRK